MRVDQQRVPGSRAARNAIGVIAAAGAILASGSTWAGGISYSDFSVVTIGRPTTQNPNLGGLYTQADITGNAFVSGTFLGSGTIGQDLPNASGSQYSLSVANGLNFGGSVDIDNGYSVIYANSNGNLGSGSFSFNGGGSLVKDTSAALGTEQTTLANQVTFASSYYSSMAQTGTVSPITSGVVTFDSSAPKGGTAVFDIAATTLTSGSLQQLKLEMNGAQNVVINVTGLNSSTDFTVPNTIGWQGDFTDANAAHIIWNFGTLGGNLTTQNYFIGSIIAPKANFENGSYVDGSIFVQSFDNTSGQTGEIHYKNGGYVVQFNGFVPQSVPEPSSIVMAGLGMAGAVLIARRRAAWRREA